MSDKKKPVVQAASRLRYGGPGGTNRGGSNPNNRVPPDLNNRNSGGDQDNNRRPNWFGFMPKWAWALLIGILVFEWLVLPICSRQSSTEVSYSFFYHQLQAKNISRVTIQGLSIQGQFKKSVSYTPQGSDQQVSVTRFKTTAPGSDLGQDNILNLLKSQDVAIQVQQPSTTQSLILNLLIGFVPTIVIFGLLFWMFNRAQQSQQGIFGMGRSRAKRYKESANTPRVTFEDVAGIEEAEAELIEIVDFLRNPAKYQRLGGQIPKGVLLVGPPGTGKTLLARAVAGEAKVPFFSMSGSEFVEMIVGVGASRVRQLFEEAKKESPSIIFVDELDAIGRRRGGNISVGGHDEREQTLNQLLVEMDGFNSAEQVVIVLAATNRADVLDPALLRPGRFDRRVAVQRPDKIGRRAILQVHIKGVPLGPDVDLNEIASATTGLVGADLKNLINEAALLAASRNRDEVTQEDFFNAMEKIVLGAERQIVLSEDDRRRIAYHESGHAVLGLLVEEADPVHKVTIVPRGQALGVTYQTPEDDRYNYTERYLRGRIIGALGGRAAEEVVLGTITTGAENDLKQVTEIAKQMVTRWGMSKEVGLVYLPESSEDGEGASPFGFGREYSDSLATTVDREVRRIIDECYAESLRILRENRHRLDALVDALLAHESLDEDEIRRVVGLEERHPRTREESQQGQPAKI